MAQWQQIQGEGWVQFADLRLADAWFARARQLAHMESVGDIDAQKQRTREAWQAFGNACRALDTPPYNMPQFRASWKRHYGTYGFGTDAATPGSFWTNGDAPPVHGDTTDHGGSSFKSEAQRLYFGQRPPGSAEVFFKVRYLVDNAGMLLDTCAGENGDCYNPAPFWMSNTTTPQQIFGGESDWTNWGFWDGGTFAWLAALNIGKVLPPVQWSMNLLREVVDQCVALGALEVLTEARLNAVLLNFRTAQRFHLLSNDALIRAAAMVPADLDAAAWTDNTQGSKVAGQEIMQAGSAVGGYYGLLITGVGLAVTLAPSAVGANVDMFGRIEPVYEAANISGGAGTTTSRERLTIPNPPGYDPYLSMPYQPPVSVWPSCLPPREFFSAASRQAWIDSHPNCPAPPPYSEPLGIGAAALGAGVLWALWRLLGGGR